MTANNENGVGGGERKLRRKSFQPEIVKNGGRTKENHAEPSITERRESLLVQLY